MGMVMDFLADEMYGLIKGRCIDLLHKQEIRSNLNDWLERQRKSRIGGWQENIDFDGVEAYVTSQMLTDVEGCLYGSSKEREAARQKILARAICSAKADDEASIEKVKTMIDSVLGMLHDYVQKNRGRQEQDLLAEIDRIIDRRFEELEEKLLSRPDRGAAPEENGKDIKPAGIYHKPKLAEYYIKTENNAQLKISIENKEKVLVLGMPGIGKTEGVVWYLEQALDLFPRIIWLNFENLEQAIDQMGEFFISVEGTKGTWPGNYHTIAADMLRKLAEGIGNCEKTIVVFDNVNNTEVLKLLTDQKFPCKIVVISCLNYHYGCFGQDQVVHWEELDEENCVSLLKEMLNMDQLWVPEEDKKALEKIAEMGGGIPLVIRQAAVFMKELQLSPQQYLKQCTQTEKLLFEQYSKKQTDVWKKNWNVYVTFWLPYHQLCEQDDTEEWFIRLFHCILFLNPNGMPEWLLTKAADISYQQLTESLRMLLRYTLLRRENGRIYIKQVVQDVLRSFLCGRQKAQTALRIEKTLAEGFLNTAPVLEKRETYVDLGSSAEKFISIIQQEKLAIEKTGDILCGVGLYNYFNGFYGMAQRSLNAALKITEKNKNKRLHLRICIQLAEVYEESGDDQMAQACIHKVDRDLEWILEEAPEMAAPVWIVEMHLHENAGEYQKAMEKADQVLELLKHTETGGNRSYFLTAIICKINIYNQNKCYFEAEEAFDLAVGELKPSRELQVDIERAYLYESRANTLLLQGKRDQAKDWYEQAIEIYQKAYPNKNHPLLAYPYVNIAMAYMESDESDEARDWLRKAENVLTKSDFQHHKLKTQVYYWCAVLEYNQGRYEACYNLFKQAVQENRFLADGKRKYSIEVRGYLMMACAKLGLQEWEAAKTLLRRIISEESYEAAQKENAAILLNVFDNFQIRIGQGEKIEQMVSIGG